MHLLWILSLFVGSSAVAGLLLYQLVPNPLALVAVIGAVVLAIVLLMALS